MERVISPEQSKEAATGTLLLLNSPRNLRLGIDHQSWQIGAKFKGIKAIPPGPHYVHYSLEEEGHQYKLSFFVFARAGCVMCRKWSEKRRHFAKMPEEEEEAYAEGVKNRDFELSLGMYPMERYEIWRETTDCITERVIGRLEVFGVVMQ